MNVIEDTILINLNSQNATSMNGTYLSNVIFNTSHLLTDTIHTIYSEISLISAQIPASFYEINYSNNTLNYKVLGIDYTIIITVGNYTGTSLITELKTKFLLNSHTFNISINRSNGILSFSLANDFQFLDTSTCKKVLGFNDTITSSSQILILPYPLNLIGIKNLIIKSTVLNINNLDNVLGVISVNVPPFDMINYTNNTNIKTILKNRVIDNIDIEIYDDRGNLINFNNTDWSLTFSLTVHKVYFHNPTSLLEVLQNN